ncbi:MAG: nicotinate (nicotinamide) nucleotide adenylyltransferase [Bacteroidota bacterium]
MKTGLYFGSFNPVHIGHMAIANYFVEYTDLDEIWFVVSPQNPLKKNNTLLPDYQRLELVYLAINDDPRFKACDIEFSMPKPSYTIDTLTYLKEKYPDKKFSVIMGADNIKTIHKWKNYQNILSENRIFIYPRQGFLPDNKNVEAIIDYVDAPLIEISSSFIRKAFKNKKNVKFFLPENVYAFIEKMNYYK